MTMWIPGRNLRLREGDALTIDAALVDPDPTDLTWADLDRDSRITWRTVAIRAGIDTSGWES